MSRIRKLQKRKSNPNLVKLIDELLIRNAENNAPVWKDMAKRLANPRKNYAEVNVSKIEKYAENGDTVLVPGKVLGSGKILKPVNVAALSFSDSARKKIEGSGGKCYSIKELAEMNPKGTGVKIIA